MTSSKYRPVAALGLMFTLLTNSSGVMAQSKERGPASQTFSTESLYFMLPINTQYRVRRDIVLTDRFDFLDPVYMHPARSCRLTLPKSPTPSASSYVIERGDTLRVVSSNTTYDGRTDQQDSLHGLILETRAGTQLQLRCVFDTGGLNTAYSAPSIRTMESLMRDYLRRRGALPAQEQHVPGESQEGQARGPQRI